MKVNFSPQDLEKFDHIGDNHIGTSSDTPIREDAFALNSDEKN
jgi:GTP cyclohydrolase I